MDRSGQTTGVLCLCVEPNLSSGQEICASYRMDLPESSSVNRIRTDAVGSIVSDSQEHILHGQKHAGNARISSGVHCRRSPFVRLYSVSVISTLTGVVLCSIAETQASRHEGDWVRIECNPR